jgi:hypothetical protein
VPYLLALIILGIIAYEVPGLIKERMWRELIAFSVLLLIGMIYSYGQVLALSLPNPATVLDFLFQPVSQYLDKILQGTPK